MFISPTYGSDRLTERIWVPLKEVADTAKESNSSTEAFSIDNGTSTEDGSVGENVGEKHKNVGEKIREEILSAIKADSKISAVTLAKKTNVTSRTVERYLQVLREEGIIIRHGAARGGYWETKE